MSFGLFYYLRSEISTSLLVIVCCVVCCVFFLQAEDGIRDLVRSRGLGDVYKRQSLLLPVIGFVLLYNVFGLLEMSGAASGEGFSTNFRERTLSIVAIALNLIPVSYTHLTLPTSDLV